MITHDKMVERKMRPGRDMVWVMVGVRGCVLWPTGHGGGRTGAYLEWLDNKLIMTANNNLNKDSLLELLSAKRNPSYHKAYHIPWSRKIIPTSRISLASTLCTQGLFTPVASAA